MRPCCFVRVFFAACSFAALLAFPKELVSSEDPLPDEFTISVGEVKDIGPNVTLVLGKRSVRAESYKLYIQTPVGLRRAQPLAVRTQLNCVR